MIVGDLLSGDAAHVGALAPGAMPVDGSLQRLAEGPARRPGQAAARFAGVEREMAGLMRLRLARRR